MKTIDLYNSYSETMMTINSLYSSQQKMQREQAPAELLSEINDQINSCRKKINSILKEINAFNPFAEQELQTIN